MIDRSTRSFSSRMRVVAPMAALAGLAAHRLPAFAQATPEASPAVSADPVAVLNSAIETMDQLKSYHFTLETEYGGITVVPEVLFVNDLEGDVLRPNAIAASGTASIILLPIPFKIVSIDGNTWITNPLGSTGLGGELVSIGSLGAMISFDPAVAVNPDHVALPLLGLIQNPTIDEAGSTDVSYKIDGVIPRQMLVKIEDSFTGTAVFASLSGDGADLTVSVWVDNESHVVALDVNGKLLANEFESLLRHYEFSNFDAPIVIEHP